MSASDNTVPITALRETLAGDLGARFGAKPMLLLPGEDNPINHFARELATLLHHSGLYLRDSLVVIPYERRKRLEIVSPAAFRSFASNHVWTYKLKYDRDKNPYQVGKSMTKDEAQSVLESLDFWPTLPEIESILPVPMPLILPDGTLGLTSPGYDPTSKTYTFNVS